MIVTFTEKRFGSRSTPSAHRRGAFFARSYHLPYPAPRLPLNDAQPAPMRPYTSVHSNARRAFGSSENGKSVFEISKSFVSACCTHEYILPHRIIYIAYRRLLLLLLFCYYCYDYYYYQHWHEYISIECHVFTRSNICEQILYCPFSRIVLAILALSQSSANAMLMNLALRMEQDERLWPGGWLVGWLRRETILLG